MATLPRPQETDQLLVSPYDAEPFLAPVERILGQYVYVAGYRFHVADDQLADHVWFLPDQQVTFSQILPEASNG